MKTCRRTSATTPTRQTGKNGRVTGRMIRCSSTKTRPFTATGVCRSHRSAERQQGPCLTFRSFLMARTTIPEEHLYGVVVALDHRVVYTASGFLDRPRDPQRNLNEKLNP